MTAFTPDAQLYLDRYLRQVKAALRGNPSVDAQEVERDVRGHIDAELHGAEPVTLSALQQVLARLGSPSQWTDFDEQPLWRRVMVRLQSGPEDWRLAYLTFALFLCGPGLGPFLGPLGPMCFIASFPFARATLSLMEEREEPIGARKWLVYPTLILWYATLALLLLIWPAPAVGGGLTQLRELHDPRIDAVLAPAWFTVVAGATLALGAWWMLLGVLLPRVLRVLRVVFWPFAESVERRHGFVLAGLGVVVAALGAAAIFAGKQWPAQIEEIGRIMGIA